MTSTENERIKRIQEAIEANVKIEAAQEVDKERTEILDYWWNWSDEDSSVYLQV